MAVALPVGRGSRPLSGTNGGVVKFGSGPSRGGSSPPSPTKISKGMAWYQSGHGGHNIGVWPSGRVPGLGPGSREFESLHPDHTLTTQYFRVSARV